MKLLKRHINYFLIAAILFELFFGLGLLVTDSVDMVRATDYKTMSVFADTRNAELSTVMKWVTELGDYEFVLHVTVIVALLAAVFGHIEIALGVVAGIAMTSYATTEMKEIFHVIRPENFIITVRGWSYPSGHAAGATILAIMTIWAAITTIPHKYKSIKITIVVIAAVYALSVAISRMYLGVHWFSDVIGGILLAGAVSMLIIGLLKPVIIKRKHRANH